MTTPTPIRASRLPGTVQTYLDRTVPSAAPVPNAIRIAQEGEITLRPGGRALRFDAVEELSVAEVRFTWKANVRVAPLVRIRVVDSYGAGTGTLDARLLGVSVARARGQETNVGEAMRYLAELAWVPHAIGANSALVWRELEDDVVEVATRAGSAEVAVDLRFDANGDILAAFADRPYREGKRFVDRHWVGAYSDYAEIDGVRIPTRAEVRWELPDGPFVYWRATVTGLEALWT